MWPSHVLSWESTHSVPERTLVAVLEEEGPGLHLWLQARPRCTPTGLLEAPELLAAAEARPDIHQHWLCEGFN